MHTGFHDLSYNREFSLSFCNPNLISLSIILFFKFHCVYLFCVRRMYCFEGVQKSHSTNREVTEQLEGAGFLLLISGSRGLYSGPQACWLFPDPVNWPKSSM